MSSPSETFDRYITLSSDLNDGILFIVCTWRLALYASTQYTLQWRIMILGGPRAFLEAFAS